MPEESVLPQNLKRVDVTLSIGAGREGPSGLPRSSGRPVAPKRFYSDERLRA